MVGVAVAIALGVSLSKSNNPGNVKSPTILPWTGICFEPDDGGRYHYQGTQEVKSQDHQEKEDDHDEDWEGEDSILYTAVRSYINQDCAINQQCPIDTSSVTYMSISKKYYNHIYHKLHKL